MTTHNGPKAAQNALVVAERDVVQSNGHAPALSFWERQHAAVERAAETGDRDGLLALREHMSEAVVKPAWVWDCHWCDAALRLAGGGEQGARQVGRAIGLQWQQVYSRAKVWATFFADSDRSESALTEISWYLFALRSDRPLTALAHAEDEKAANPAYSRRDFERWIRDDSRTRAAEAGAARLPAALADRCTLLPGDFREVVEDLEPGSVDAIITDPPYPSEYLPLYGALAEDAARLLKPGGSLLVMVGQSYLPELLALMTPHIRYHWTVAHLTPGGQAVQLWQRKVNTFYKPVLWFVNGDYDGPWVGDVTRSAVNDNDKRFHDWGQSESGMADLVERFTRPGDTILDPFLGGGTTAVVALRLQRQFIGIELDRSTLSTALRRVAALAREGCDDGA